MNRLWLIMLVCLCACFDLQSQIVAVKTNVLSDVTTTPSLGVEVAFDKHFSVDLTGEYNGWKLGGGKTLQHWTIQPEVRYWLMERFNGHYFGVHALYSDFDYLGITHPWGMKKDRAYDGTGYGAGVSYGYQLYLTPHWNIEFTAGIGYMRMEYDKYTYPDMEYMGKFRNNYFGLTKAGISIVYIIK